MGEKERAHEISSLWKEIATLVAEKSVDPETQRPIPTGLIEKAMTEAGFSVKQGKPAKSQVRCALSPCITIDAYSKVSECIKLLQTNSKLPIQRARMRIRVHLPEEHATRLNEQIIKLAEKVEEVQTVDGRWEAVSVSLTF